MKRSLTPIFLGLALLAALAYRTVVRPGRRTVTVSAVFANVRSAGRPAGDALWQWYRPVSYADHNSGPGLQEAWQTIGGTLGQEGGSKSWLPCAAELSYALDRSGAAIPPVSGASNRNSDGKRYIISARQMRRYLWSRWGRPDHASYPVAGCAPDSPAFLGALHVGAGVAVFATDNHVGVVRAGYADPILPYLGVADIWVLPG
jgi:hypothetical protein